MTTGTSESTPPSGAATVRVFVNGAGLDVPAGATALDAVRAWNAGQADAVAGGARLVTDSRGLPVATDAAVYAGAIFRLVANRGRASATPSGDAGSRDG